MTPGVANVANISLVTSEAWEKAQISDPQEADGNQEYEVLSRTTGASLSY